LEGKEKSFHTRKIRDKTDRASTRKKKPTLKKKKKGEM